MSSFVDNAGEAAVATKVTGTLSTDGTFAANSDSLVPSQKAAKTYTDAQVLTVAGGYATADTNILAVYKTLVQRNTVVNDAQTSATRIAVPSGAVVSSTAATIAAASTFAIDTTELAVSGKTTKLNLQVTCMTNATSVGTCTFTGNMHAVTGVAGAADTSSVTLGAAVSGASVAFANPSTSTITTSTSGDFTIPTTGQYALTVLNSATPAADSFVSLVLTLRFRHV